MQNQNNLLKRIKAIDGNHSKTFSAQHTQSDNFIIPRHYVKHRDTSKCFTIDTRNQFQSLQNVIEEQSNNNELNMVQETTNNPRNDPTMTAEKSIVELPSSTNPADKKNAKKALQNSQQVTKKY